MKNENLSKTILSIYRYLPRVAMAIDKLVKTRAYNSACSSMINVSYNSGECVANSILNLSERKITLINIKVLTENALKNMKPILAKILIWKYIDGLKSIEISNKLGICIRSYFRKLNLALSSFSKSLTRLNYDEEKLYNLIKNEKWIMEVFYSLCSNCDKEENIMEDVDFRNKIKKSIILDFRRKAKAY